MKINIFILFFVIAFLNSSCYSIKYTHTQVMNMAVTNQSKDGILNNFGIPTEKRVAGSYEEWIYDLGQRTISIGLPSTSNTTIRVNPSYDRASINTNTYGGGVISRTYNTYIKITFQNGRASKWETAGVDYTVTKNEPAQTALLIITTLAISIGLGVWLGNALY